MHGKPKTVQRQPLQFYESSGRSPKESNFTVVATTTTTMNGKLVRVPSNFPQISILKIVTVACYDIPTRRKGSVCSTLQTDETKRRSKMDKGPMLIVGILHTLVECLLYLTASSFSCRRCSSLQHPRKSCCK